MFSSTCQWRSIAPNITTHCTAKSTCKWGDFWFCDEHGGSRGSAPLLTDKQHIDLRPALARCQRMP